MLDLPAGWLGTTLSAVTTPRVGKADPQASPDAKFIGMEQVEAQSMRLLGTVPAGSMRSSANTFQPRDVLYGRLRAYLNKVYQPGFSGLCSGEFIVMPETEALHGRFLKYRLNASDFVRFASQLNTGDRPRVDWTQIQAFGIDLPPRPEQERIADALDELVSELDAGIAALERARAKLKLYRASVLKAAVEGALTADWRAQHPDAEPASELLKRILAERRRRWEAAQLQKFKQAGKPPPKNWQAKYKGPVALRLDDLPSLPDRWTWSTADQLCTQVTDGEHIQPRYKESGLPMLTAKNVRDGFVDFDDKGLIGKDEFAACLRRCAPKKDDVLIVSVGATTGRAAIVAECEPFAIVRSVLLLRPIPVPRFILRWIQSPWCQAYIQRASGSSAQAHLYIGDTKAIPVPLPPAEEQEVIAEMVDDQLSGIDHLEADLDAKLKSAQVLRQSILRDAFAGKLVPQDPDDEPASVLLERIAAERAQRGCEAKAAKRAPSSRRVARKRAKTSA